MTQTQMMTLQECHLCSCRRAGINHLWEEIRRLKEELAQKRLGEDYFKDDDAKVKYYTGLLCFMLLMGVLTSCLPQIGPKTLTFSDAPFNTDAPRVGGSWQ